MRWSSVSGQRSNSERREAGGLLCSKLHRYSGRNLLPCRCRMRAFTGGRSTNVARAPASVDAFSLQFLDVPWELKAQ